MRKFFYYLILVISIQFIIPGNDCFSQWTKTIGPANINAISLAASGADVIAGTFRKGIYYSTNYGSTWAISNLDTEWVNAMAINGTTVYAGMDDQ